MVEAIIVAIGAVAAQLLIAWRTNNLLVYRLDELEKKQDKHNNLIERMVKAETDICSHTERLQRLEGKK